MGGEDRTRDVVMNECSEKNRALRNRFRSALSRCARSTLWRETIGFPSR